MKYLVIVLSLLTGAANAQSTRFGLKAGLSVATLARTTADYKTGLLAGAVAYTPLGRHGAFQAELLYSQKGFFGTGGTGVAQQSDQTLHYLDLPLLAKLRLGGLYFEAGVQAAVLLTASTTYRDQQGRTGTIDNAGNFRGTDAGYILGLGYQSDAGLLMGLRYNGGLSDVAGDATAGIPVNRLARNAAVQLWVGYLFRNRDGHAWEFSQ